MSANVCILLLVIGWFVMALPISIVVLINSIIKLKERKDVIKYSIVIAVCIIYIILKIIELTTLY